MVEAVRHLQLLLNKMSLPSNCRIVESAIPEHQVLKIESLSARSLLVRQHVCNLKFAHPLLKLDHGLLKLYHVSLNLEHSSVKLEHSSLILVHCPPKP